MIWFGEYVVERGGAGLLGYHGTGSLGAYLDGIMASFNHQQTTWGFE
jgi:hypothetical protein